MPGEEVGSDKEMLLTEKERKQIELQREIRHGQLTVYLKNGEPIRLEHIKKSIML